MEIKTHCKRAEWVNENDRKEFTEIKIQSDSFVATPSSENGRKIITYFEKINMNSSWSPQIVKVKVFLRTGLQFPVYRTNHFNWESNLIKSGTRETHKLWEVGFYTRTVLSRISFEISQEKWATGVRESYIEFYHSTVHNRM